MFSTVDDDAINEKSNLIILRYVETTFFFES